MSNRCNAQYCTLTLSLLRNYSISYHYETCPAYSDGVVDGTLPAEIVETFASFVLVADPIKLATEDGTADCYPFADSTT
jgi:hypothetical protein